MFVVSFNGVLNNLCEVLKLLKDLSLYDMSNTRSASGPFESQSFYG